MYGFGIMEGFGADYFNSPAFQQAIAAAVQQYSPAPVEPVYYAPEPVSYDYQGAAGIGGVAPYQFEDYSYLAPQEDVYVNQRAADERAYAEQVAAQAEAQRIAAERAAAEQAIAAQAAAQAEAQRIAAAQELAARVEAERVAAERAAAAEAAAQRQQTELNERRAQAAQAAAERASQERALAEQAAAQAAAEAQAAAQAQAQAAAQAEAQRVAAAQAQAEAQAAAQAQVQAQVAEQARVQAEVQAYEPEPFRGIGRRGNEDYFVSESGLLPEQTYTPEPVYTPPPVAAPVYTPAEVSFRGIGRRGNEDLYESDVQAPETYTSAPALAPAAAPATVSSPPAENVRGIGSVRGDVYDYFEPDTPEPVYTQAVEPMTVEAEPVAGIGSPAVAATAAAPSIIETAAAAPAPAAGTGLQVVDANSWSPSDSDLQAMTLTRDQWNDAMASFSGINLGNLNFYTGGNVNPDYTDKYRVFTAPKSNKGNPTSTVAKKDNTFNLIEGQPIRLVDMRTGKVVFQGTGYEAAEKAIELAAGLTKAGGNKADWEIQTSQFKNPGSGDLQFGGAFKTVANEKKNTSFINQALDVIGDAALGFIVGGPVGAAIAAGASVAGVNVSDIAYPMIAAAILGPSIGAAALGSAVSSAVQGRSIEETLIRAAAAGATAGVMGGTEIGGEVSKAVGGVLKDIGFESQVGGLISGIGAQGAVDSVTGDIVVSAASRAAEAALNDAVSSAISGAISTLPSLAIADAAKQIFPDYQPSPETTAALNNLDAAAASNPIVVDGSVATGALSGSNPIVGTVANGVITPILGVTQPSKTAEEIQEEKTGEIVAEAPRVVEQPVADTATSGIGDIVPVKVPPSTVATETNKTAEEIEEEKTGEIVAEAPRVVEQPVADTATSGIGGIVNPISDGVIDRISDMENDPATDEIKVIGNKTEPVVVTPDVINPVTETLDVPKMDPKLTEKSLLDKAKDVLDVVNTATAVLPIVGGIAGGGGGGGGTLTPDTTGINFTKTTLRPTIPAGGIGGIGGTGGRYPYTPETYGRRGGDQETEYLFFTKDPVTGQETVQSAPAVSVVNPDTVPVKKEGGEINDDMVKHLVDYHKNGGHQGPGQVKGIGSGQEDKIPAYLSDGEYVWSAQDVSDLGDGSNREGVRRLDKMRQMVRSQAGRKDVKKIAKPQKGIDRMLKAVGGMA